MPRLAPAKSAAKVTSVVFDLPFKKATQSIVMWFWFLYHPIRRSGGRRQRNHNWVIFDWISCHCNSADLITGSGYSVVVGKGGSIALADCQFFKGKVTHSSNGKVWMRKNATQIRDFNKNVLIHNFKTISCLISLFHLLRISLWPVWSRPDPKAGC